jgi:ABC-2 type transport system permease protein
VAVYERSYKGYTGELTPVWSRFLVMPRYAFRRVFSSRIFLAFYLFCGLPWVVAMFLVYLRHNLQLLEKLNLKIIDLPDIGPTFFAMFLFPAPPASFGIFMFVGFVLVLVVGPPLISSDMIHNGMPLYLARPIRRREYVLGKMSVLAILLSAISWVPGLMTFLLQAYMAGDGWLWKNLRIGVAIFVGSWIYIIVFSLLALAISASVKRKTAARVLLFGVIVLLASFGGIVAEWLGLKWGYMLHVYRMIGVVWADMIGLDSSIRGVSVWAALFSLLCFCGISLWILARKVRAYEVVK